MRKILLFTLAASVIATIAGCLKDKDFEKEKYGLQIKDVAAVSLAEAPNSPVLAGLNAVATPQTITTAVHVEAAQAAKQDIHIKLELDNNLVTAEGYTPVPLTSFSVPLDLTITAGTWMTEFNITVPNASVLNPNLTYGVGLRIKTVDAGYIIGANLKELVIAFSLKNEWDGDYKVLKSQVIDPNRPTISSAIFGTSPQLNVDLITSGANSVVMEWTNFAPPIQGHAAPLVAGGWTSFGNAQPKYIWDANNVLTAVENNMFAAPQNRTFQLIRGKRNMTTKIVVAEYNMLQATFLPVYHYDSLLYVGPR
jgi:hypothetical protein